MQACTLLEQRLETAPNDDDEAYILHNNFVGDATKGRMCILFLKHYDRVCLASNDKMMVVGVRIRIL